MASSDSGWEVFTRIPDIYADDTILCIKCDQASDLRQQLKLASELESDLQDTVNWNGKWLVDFSVGKTQLVLFNWYNHSMHPTFLNWGERRSSKSPEEGMKIFKWGIKIEGRMENKGGWVTIICSVFTFLTEAFISYKISYSYSTRTSIVFCLNVFLSKHLFEVIILIVFSLLFSLRYFQFTFYLQPNSMFLYEYQE